MDLKERLLNGILKVESGCWEWQGALRSGYGAIKLNNIVQSTHRLSYIIFKGEIKKGLLVCHTCDNRKCINPEHLFLGTYEDNMQDCLKKGRLITPKNLNFIKHPSQSSYRKGCRCSECREIMRVKIQMDRQKVKLREGLVARCGS